MSNPAGGRGIIAPEDLPELDATQLRALLDHSLARIAYLDRDRRHRYTNPEYAAFVGATPKELIGRSVADVLGAEAAATTEAPAMRALAGESLRWAGWLLYRGRGRVYEERAYHPIYGLACCKPDGARSEIVGYFVVVRDLTELKTREEELGQRSGTLEAILTHMAEGVNIVSPDGRVVLANEGFLQMYGFSARLGRSGTPLVEFVQERLARGDSYPHENPDEAIEALTQKRLAELLAVGDETFEEQRPGGRIIEVRRRRLPDRSLISTYTDVTLRHRAEAELHNQRDALREAERLAALGSLLAGVAHELNNPLSIVVAHASLLEEEAAGPQSVRAQKIRSAAERCARIVSTFLDMARRRPARTESVALADVLAQALDLVGYGLRAAGIDVKLSVPDSLPPIWADPDQMVQVFLNLIGNAQQAMADWQAAPPGRQKRLTITGTADGSGVRVLVADTGPGIPDDARGRIFDPFFTTKPEGKGTGVGLPLCRSIIVAHRGSITAEDTPGGGCTMVLRLPTASTAAAGAAAPDSAGGAAMAGRQALVIDDEPAVGEAIAEILAADGFAVEVVQDGRTAMQRLSGRDFDVIFCDLRMPDPDGPSILGWLRSARPRQAERLVFVTGDRLGVETESLLAATGRPVVEKPFQPALVRRTARAVLAAAQSSG
ncbi:MAG: PAS-domain containing protein [Acetobacteraceae bacterium]|nr:PAS-domain containing protein [Acetobacteraceae bacterium]